MITLKELKWSNVFSYGEDNYIDFTNSKLLQLLGANGNGKSSIALILEEVLYNKNSKGIKKGDILNRYTTDKFYTISLSFLKNNDEYLITTRRGSTQQVKLYINGDDISSHTATGTYKLIEEIMGIDHKTFCQIVCQSNSSSLEFLTSADTARKKFLIELLNLSKYTKIGDRFKQLSSDMAKELATVEGKVDTIKQWITKYSNADFTRLELKEVPNLPEDMIAQVTTIKSSLSDIVNTNKKIVKNNTYIERKNQIVLSAIPAKPTDDLNRYTATVAISDKAIQNANSFIKKMTSLGDQCPTCLQSIDIASVRNLIEEQEVIINENKTLITTNLELIKEYQEKLKIHDTARLASEEWEKLHQLIDISLPTDLLNEVELQRNLKLLEKQITDTKAQVSTIESQNKVNKTHNDKLELIESQIIDMQKDLVFWSNKLTEINAQLFKLTTLAKAFSTTGLVAYKIENLAKDLEDISNLYLSELSDGRFQISFQISGSDKLNVVITDNGTDIQIEALSKGETTRVNLSVLLAIRKLMQSISDSRINLLFLDETISTLDINGRERLVEVLLEEDNLNTILVSHEFTHPLLEKITVSKDQKVSRIYKE